ncbi:MAG: hypothetical protein E7286_02065 [Lachnospiraceae bacterium]|nr:hypothetical protein [Lachnospiraceae bacterium]
MKKLYVKPMMQGEQFVADEYVSACYQGYCDISGAVFTDDGDGVYEPEVDKYKYTNTACENEYWVEGLGVTLPEKNAFVVSTSDTEQVVVGHTPIIPFPIYETRIKSGVTPTRVWNFDDHHVTTTMNPQSRSNHS